MTGERRTSPVVADFMLKHGRWRASGDMVAACPRCDTEAGPLGLHSVADPLTGERVVLCRVCAARLLNTTGRTVHA